MPRFRQTIVIALLAFTIPLSFAAYSNWDAVRPFVIGDASTADGYLLYFARRG